MVGTLRQAVGWALPAQIVWALLASLWNVAGVSLIAQGQRPLGPTATMAGAITLIVIVAVLLVTVRRAPLIYAAVSGVAALIALGAVVNAFRQDPALWPSEFWRYAGAVLNAVGFVAGAAAVWAYFRSTSR
jgi:hypothetical protein